MTDSTILFSRLPGQGGDLAQVVLNRPKALNALTKEMCIALYQQLIHWQKDPSVKAVIVKSASDKAFCAGGDVRRLYDNGPWHIDESLDFFFHEYRMNRLIFQYTKPYIALLDGITMGGGCGISMHGSHRIATEKLLLAMPETGIGYFPDVGSGYFLARCPHYSGLYLGLTGSRIGLSDALYTGFVTQAIASERLDEFISTLASTPWQKNAKQSIDEILARFSIKCAPASLKKVQALMRQTFSQASLTKIIQTLYEIKSPHLEERNWCEKTAKKLNALSPNSLWITFKHIQKARQMNFDQALKMEFRLASHFLKSHDFYEGIRALLVDKDQHPNWQPKTLDEINPLEMDLYFAPSNQELSFAEKNQFLTARRE